MNRIVPLDDLDGRVPRIGKISAGYTDARTTNGKTVTFPIKSRTLVFRGSEREPLEAAATIVGGDVSASPNPRAEGLWRLISKVPAIDVVIADEPRDRLGRYEFWGKQGKLRDCDGAPAASSSTLRTASAGRTSPVSAPPMGSRPWMRTPAASPPASA